MKEGWNVIIRYDQEFDHTNVWLVKQMGHERVVVNPVDLAMTRELGVNEMPPEPTLAFHGNEAHQFLQELTNALVESGFKPDELKALSGELDAVQNHLEDMRRLVFKPEAIMMRRRRSTW